MTAIDIGLGWIVAAWLFMAFLAIFALGSFNTAFLCMGGAMLTAIIWIIYRRISRDHH